MSQRQLGERVGASPSRVGQIERGRGTGATLELLSALAVALDMPLTVDLGRDVLADVADAGHLSIQELVLSLARKTGRGRTFELTTRPMDTGHSIDVLSREDRLRVLMIQECWNTFGNINAAVRSTRRKIADAEQVAVAIGGDEGPYRVAAVWVVRDTRANRALLARYPEVFAAAFIGSSSQWVNALTQAESEPPAELGLIWTDLRSTRVFAWRKR